jgi:hypothetical protein
LRKAVDTSARLSHSGANLVCVWTHNGAHTEPHIQ